MAGTMGSATLGPIVLHAAGSLEPALSAIVREFEDSGGISVRAWFGPSGLLCDAILRGEPADIFASANMQHPDRLAQALGGRVYPFARNAMCALASTRIDVDPASLIDAMLDSAIRLGISTPVSDPSGDYAFAVFDLAEVIRPGASAALRRKALQLTGRSGSRRPPAAGNVYGNLLEAGEADIFLTYRTNARAALEGGRDLALIDLPADLAVSAEYGLVALPGRREALDLAEHVLSPRGQAVLARFGFSPAAG